MHRSDNKQKSFFMPCSSDLHKNYTAAHRNKGSLWGKSEGTITVCTVAGWPYKHQDMLGDKKKISNTQKNPSLLSKILWISYPSIAIFLWTLCREMLLHSPWISLALKFGLAAPTTSPMLGKGCSKLEAPGWLLTLVSPFHVLFPTINLQVPDLQCMAGVLSSPSLSLKDGLALLAQQAPHYTPVQTLLPHSSSHQPETRFLKPKLEPPRSPLDLQDKDLTSATLAASPEHFCCHQGKASIWHF